jgi:hypothetical protein
MNNPIKEELIRKLDEASNLIFKIERCLVLGSDLRQRGFHARIKIAEFQNQIQQAKDDDLQFKNHENGNPIPNSEQRKNAFMVSGHRRPHN